MKKLKLPKTRIKIIELNNGEILYSPQYKTQIITDVPGPAVPFVFIMCGFRWHEWRNMEMKTENDGESHILLSRDASYTTSTMEQAKEIIDIYLRDFTSKQEKAGEQAKIAFAAQEKKVTYVKHP